LSGNSAGGRSAGRGEGCSGSGIGKGLGGWDGGSGIGDGPEGCGEGISVESATEIPAAMKKPSVPSDGILSKDPIAARRSLIIIG
jgi:hypothetical protein